MFDSVQGGLPIVCLMGAIIGWVGARVRRLFPGLGLAIAGPVALSYGLAWEEMSPLLHRQAEPPGGWDLVAAIYWTAWALPISIVVFGLARWWQARHAL